VLFRNFPNPFAGKTTVEFYLPAAAQASFRLHDQFGRLLKTWSSDYEQGRHQLPLDLTDVPSGILFLEMEANNSQQQVIKMMKK
jgi:Secretion system C-terminal sorting domain